MVHPIKLPIALAFLATAITAQCQNQTSAFVVQMPTSQSCPVSMQAQQRGSGSVVSTGQAGQSGQTAPGNQAGRRDQIAQHIHLVLAENRLSAKDNSSRVTQAKVTVFGTNGKWRILTAQAQFASNSSPLNSAQPSSPYAEKTLNLTLNPVTTQEENPGAYADLDLPGFTSVKSIRLDSITYADGTIWKPNSGQGNSSQVCRVYPDPLMLVSSR